MKMSKSNCALEVLGYQKLKTNMRALTLNGTYHMNVTPTFNTLSTFVLETHKRVHLRNEFDF